MTGVVGWKGKRCHDTINCIVSRDRRSLRKLGLYRNTPRCIVTGQGHEAGTVSRHGREAKPRHGA